MKLRYITVGVVVLILGGILSTIVTGSWFVRRKTFERNYSQIQIGDSEQKVIELYGQPVETSDCSEYKRPSYLEVVQKYCVKVYWYRSFLKQWVFFFDKDGKVIHKAYNVLY
jgi:hypothetical protein